MTDHVSTHASEEDIRNESILIYVDGRIVPKRDAVVSALARRLTFLLQSGAE